MLQNFKACFLKPNTTNPKTIYTPEFLINVWFVGVSDSQSQYGKFAGVTYQYELTCKLSPAYRVVINETWQVAIDGITYSIQAMPKTVTTPNGYQHSIFALSKRT